MIPAQAGSDASGDVFAQEWRPRVLAVTNMYPTVNRPAYGTFVRVLVDALRCIGVPVDVLFVDGRDAVTNYARGIYRLRSMLTGGPYDVIHAHYGLTAIVTRFQHRLPVVVSYCGSDVMGHVEWRDGEAVLQSPLRPRALATIASHVVEPLVDAIIVKSEQMRGQL